MFTLSKIDGLLKAIGITTIGIVGIGLVLSILSVMCILVAVFAYETHPSSTPTITIGPPQGPLASPTGAPAGTVIFDETRTMPDGHYQDYTMAMKAGMSLGISVATDGLPVDVMVMDGANYSAYTAAVGGSGDGKWQGYASECFVIRKSLEFAIPRDGQYYVVVDNTPYPEDGASAGKPISVHTVITYVG